ARQRHQVARRKHRGHVHGETARCLLGRQRHGEDRLGRPGGEHRYSAATRAATCSSGNTQVTVVPRPTAESIVTVPPCNSTKERTIERPSPVPRWREPEV